jgi:DHA2 family multidrug resistance protein
LTRQTGRNWPVLLTVMVGSVAGILSSTMINVAVPDISAHFRLSPASVQWVATGYMLAMTLSMLLTPWLLARFGLRRSYTWAVVLLLLGGILGGTSGSFPMLLAMRAMEGIAAGIIQPIPVIVIVSTFRMDLQGRAMGLYGVGVVMVPTLGPLLGGILVELLGWRAIFFAGVPFSLLVLLLIPRYLPRRENELPQDRILDWRGLLLSIAGVLAFLNGLVHLKTGPAAGCGFMAAGVACLFAFVKLQARLGEGALLNLRLFKHRQFAMGALVSFIYGMGLFGSTYLLPVFLQSGLHYAPAQSGLVLLPAGLVLAATMGFAGNLAERVAPRWLVVFGLIVLSLSFFSLSRGSSATTFLTLVWLVILGRIGLGFVLPALNLGALRGLDEELVIQGASAINFLRQLGGAIGVSLIGIVLEWRLAVRGAPLHRDGQGAGIAAFNETLMLVAALCAIAVLAAWRMRPHSPNESAARQWP